MKTKQLAVLTVLALAVMLCGCSTVKSLWSKVEGTINSAIDTSTRVATNAVPDSVPVAGAVVK